MLYQYDIFRGGHQLGKELRIVREYDTGDITSNPIDDYEKMLLMSDIVHLNEMPSERAYVLANGEGNELLGIFLHGIGDIDGLKTNTRNILEFLFLIDAESFILVHNHPNNVLIPSEPDLLTHKMYFTLGMQIGVPLTGDCIMTLEGFHNIGDGKTIIFDEYEN